MDAGQTAISEGVRDEKLKKLHEKALALAQRIEQCRFIHVAREHNRHADRLANRAIDNAHRPSSH